MADNIEKLRLYDDIYNPEMMTDENSLANALLTQPDLISPVLAHLAGSEDKKFPLSFLTEGANRVRLVNDIEYDWPVIGRLNKVVATSGNFYTSSEQPGKGYTTFYALFEDRWFVKQQVIESPDGKTHARIQSDPIRQGNGWKYELVLANATSADDFCPPDQLDAGSLWGALFAPVAASGSRGNESPWVAPSKMRNQLTHIRKSYGYEGNMPNKTTNVQFNIPGVGTTDLWMPFEEWQHMLKWREEKEYLNWYSNYNRDSSGAIQAPIDENGKPIPIGSGLLEQIPNYDTYSVLTANKIKNIVGDVFFGATDSQKMNVVLFTGTGGLRAFDEAMKAELDARTYTKDLGGKFVTGSGRTMELGGFFTTYHHVDGHSVTVRHVPLFDHGVRALKSGKHPETGLPLESYRFVFVDMSMYEGVPNVLQVSQKGRQMVRAVVNGVAPLPMNFPANASPFVATDKDAVSVHFMTASGIMIRRATNCMNLECVAQ
jgi:hypothetical protein